MFFITHCYWHKEKTRSFLTSIKKNTTEATKLCFHTGTVNTSSYPSLHLFPRTSLGHLLCTQSRYLTNRSPTPKAASTSVHKCQMRHAGLREMLMWMCSRGVANSIRLCGKCSVNNHMPSVWSRYFKEKYVRNAGRTSNEPLFGIRLGSPPSGVLCSCSHIDVDIL